MTPGQIVSIDYAVSDDSDEITDLIFTFTDAIGNSRQLRVDNTAGIALNGTITQTVPSGWVNGSYRLADVDILDAAGNQSSYGRNGTIYKYPQGATGPTSHTLNFSTADFAVATAPDAPLAVTAKAAGDLAAEVRWQASSANGSPVTGYTITSSPGGLTQTVDGTATTGTVTGLANGTDVHLHGHRDQRHRRLGRQSALQPGCGRPRSRRAHRGLRGSAGTSPATVAWDAAGGQRVPGHRVHDHQLPGRAHPDRRRRRDHRHGDRAGQRHRRTPSRSPPPTRSGRAPPRCPRSR